MTRKEAERQEAIDKLKVWLKPGDTVYCILRSRSRSGMSRTIQLVKMEEGREVYLGWNAAKATGMSYDEKREGVRVGGCGMDMGFHLVYELSHTLFAEGFQCIGKECPSNSHFNDRTEPRDGTVFHKNGAGGYALRHRWL